MGFQKTFRARAGIGSSSFNTSVLNPENLKISRKIKCHSDNNFQTKNVGNDKISLEFILNI